MAISSRLESNSLSDRVVQYIFEYIRERELHSGDRMPSEMQISADLKISRGIVREAFRSLSAAGILEVGAGRSPKVGALNNALLTHVMRHALSTRQVSPEQVLDLRCSIEVRAAELAAEMCTEKDVADLRTAVSGMNRALKKNPDRWVQNDIWFHEIISGATGNPLFRFLVGTLRECMETSIRAGLESRTTRAQLTRIVETHSALVDAIGSRQATRAGYIMKVHFDEAKDALRGGADAARREIVNQSSVISQPNSLAG
jgi:GntR family transcriptional regulator, transcriptional repressor for pyruvate dehydrogenase complex